MFSDYTHVSKPEAERLAILAEECAEVIQVVSKIQRHGFDNHHPDNPTVTNRDLLAKELGDVEHAISMLVSVDVHSAQVSTAKMAKAESIKPWLRHQQDVKRLQVE